MTLRLWNVLRGPALALWLLLSCAGVAAAGDRLTIGIQLEPPILDPTLSAAASIGDVTFPQIYEGLVRIGPGWKILPSLATSWTIAPDGLTYTFHLRRNVRFGDGTAFDATAVKFSLDRAIAPASLNPQRSLLDCIASVTVIDPLTVRLHLSRRYYSLLDVLGLPAAAILSPRSAATDLVHPVGTGPFTFVSWQRGNQIEFARNPDYWGQQPKLAHVVYRVIADPNAALDAVVTGEVDLYPAFPAPEAVERLKADRRLEVKSTLGDAKVIMAIDNRRPPFNDLRVRRALSYAVDRQAIVDAAMYGYGAPIGSHFVRKDPGYVDLTGEYPYDPVKARRLLAEAGYPNGFSTTLTLPPLSYAKRSGEIIAAELGAAGIKVKIVQLDFVPWLTQVFGAHDFDLTIVAHVEPMDYDIYSRDAYYFGYVSPQYKAVLRQLNETSDPPKRLALLGRLQRIITGDAVNVFLFQPPYIAVINENVHGVWPPDALGRIDVAAADVSGADSTPAAGAAATRAAGAVVALLAGIGFVLVAIGAGWPYLLRRSISLLLTLLVASLVIFAAMQLVPGDPARAVLGMNATPAAVASLRSQMGLDAPFPARYLLWFGGLLHGDFGLSWTYHEPVRTLIAERLAVSLPLTLYALALSTLIALALGLGAVLWRDGPLGLVFSTIGRLGLAIPNFWFGLMLVIPFALGLNWFSAGGFPGWSAGLSAVLRALTLPALALALPQAAVLARVLQFELLELQDQDFLRTARAKGIGKAGTLLRHALPNALIPVLTILGMQFSFLLAGGILIENVFFLPGLGRLMFQAITERDAIVVQSVAIVLVAEVVIVTLLADIAAAYVDPRRRAEASPSGAAR